LADELGAPKALALARQMGWLLNESFTAVAGDVAKPDAELAKELAQADVIIDASASAAVSRHLADLENSAARRLCVFFNPAGTAVVLLAENHDRSDRNAVALYGADGKDIGFLPRETAEEIAPRLDRGSPVTATVSLVEPFETDEGRKLLGVRLWLIPHRLKRRATK
jgi:hypothetical protein